MLNVVTLWSVRFAVAACVVRYTLLAAGIETWRPTWSRAAWTVGFTGCMVHVLAAFAFHHNWSHVQAVRHTAEITADVTGINWGGGIWFNYAFLAIWAVDVIVMWRRTALLPPIQRAMIGRQRMKHAVFVFMILNATVVFGPTYWIPVMILACAVVGAAYYNRMTLTAAIRRDS